MYVLRDTSVCNIKHITVTIHCDNQRIIIVIMQNGNYWTITVSGGTLTNIRIIWFPRSNYWSRCSRWSGWTRHEWVECWEGFDVVDGIATTDVAALYRAVGNLDVNAVETIVKSGVDVNCHDAKYRCNYAIVLDFDSFFLFWNLSGQPMSIMFNFA